MAKRVHITPYLKTQQNKIREKLKNFMEVSHDCSNDFPCSCKEKLESMVDFVEDTIEYSIDRATDKY